MLSGRLRLHAESRPAVTTVHRPQRQSLSFAAGCRRAAMGDPVGSLDTVRLRIDQMALVIKMLVQARTNDKRIAGGALSGKPQYLTAR